MYVLLVLCLLLVSHVQARTPSRYPNELEGDRFFATARWRALVPLVSTMADVRRALGDPAEATDMAHDSKPYPGDAAAEQPLFIYEVDANWQMLVYSAGSEGEHPEIPARLHNRLFSFDFIPKKPLPFAATFPKMFVRKQVLGADAAWNEYGDGSGLIYSVYTGPTPFGNEKSGDLNRISYGPSREELKRVADTHPKRRGG